MFFASRVGIGLTLLGLAAGIQPVCAQTTQNYGTHVINPFYTTVDQFTITTDAGSPTFNRPAVIRPGITQSFPNLSGLGTAVAYGTHGFTAADNATYRITNTTTGYDSQDFLQVLYSPSFDPTDPLTNAALSYIPDGTSGQYSLTGVAAGTALTFVNTGYYNATDTSAGHVSVGTSTTTIDELNNGSTTFIPDADTQGDITSASQTLNLNTNGLIDSFNSFSFVGLQHGAVGDLSATLTHDGVTVTLFDQPDTPATPDNFGSLAAFDASQTYTFTDNGADLATVARGTVDAAGPDPSQAYFPLLGGNYQSLGSLSAFDGTDLVGAWTLTTTDHQIGNTGSFLGFTFNATTTPVPESSTGVSLALGCGVFALLLIKRRRRASSPTVTAPTA